MSEDIRCFIAIELSREIKEALGRVEGALKKDISGVKWVRPEGIHLTLKFLGHIEKGATGEISGVLDKIAAGINPFKINLSSAGAFPSVERPRVIWIGVGEGAGESSGLANTIEEKLSPLGVEKEKRAFHPHLTLARVKFPKDANAIKSALDSLRIPPAEMNADKITLFQSVLGREGAVYSVIHESKFKNPSPA